MYKWVLNLFMYFVVEMVLLYSSILVTNALLCVDITDSATSDS